MFTMWEKADALVYKPCTMGKVFWGHDIVFCKELHESMSNLLCRVCHRIRIEHAHHFQLAICVLINHAANVFCFFCLRTDYYLFLHSWLLQKCAYFWSPCSCLTELGKDKSSIESWLISGQNKSQIQNLQWFTKG